jgi:Tn3 transposase DDE domain
VERIDEDLDLHAKKKKLLRLADAEFLAGQTLDLPKLELQLRELQIDKIQLETGPPRTDACIVYLFLIVLPIRTVHAGPNPKYFGQLKGVTWYNLLSDQFTGLRQSDIDHTHASRSPLGANNQTHACYI